MEIDNKYNVAAALPLCENDESASLDGATLLPISGFFPSRVSIGLSCENRRVVIARKPAVMEEPAC